jgi:fatty-acyl-CoA synthase
MQASLRTTTAACVPTPFRRELTPISFLERSGTVHRDRTAVIDGPRSFTYGEWRSRCRQLAHALRLAGLRKGDRVAFLAFNSEPLLLAHFAVPQAGGVLVAINTRLSASEVGYILKHSGARWVFHSSELAHLTAECEPGIHQVDIEESFDSFIGNTPDTEPEEWLQDEYEQVAIDYTSGTTGRPRGAVYHHRGAYLNALGIVIEDRLNYDSRYLWTLPMFHCNGWSHTWALVAAGATSICIPNIQRRQVWELLDEERVTHLNAAPTVLIMLMNDPAAHRLQRRVRVATGGAAPSPTLIGQMEDMNIELQHLYGLTETYGPVALNIPSPGFDVLTPDQQARFMARQGVAHITAGKQRVVDSEMSDVPSDGETLGEIVVCGNTVMSEYYHQPEATAAAFRGGWFHTGDVGVIHPDGYVELRDRKKDVIISGGENISTIEVEQTVASHPAVLEVAVIGVPDETWGEVPKAFVVLKQGRDATADEIIAHVRSRIAHFKAPKSVEFGDLPKTSTGKIQKFVLRDQEWAGRQRRIN